MKEGDLISSFLASAGAFLLSCHGEGVPSFYNPESFLFLEQGDDLVTLARRMAHRLLSLDKEEGHRIGGCRSVASFLSHREGMSTLKEGELDDDLKER